MKIVKHIVVFFLAVLFGALSLGCGAASFHAFDPKVESVKTIGLLTVPSPNRYVAHDAGSSVHMLGLLGPIGKAVEMSEGASMNDVFNAAVESNHLDFGAEMSSAVTQRLERAGFHVVPVQVARAEPNTLLSDYGSVPAAGVDAFLDIVAYGVGYVNPPTGDSGLRPIIDANLQLVSAKTRNVLYSEAVSFGYARVSSITWLPGSKRYYFADFDALMANTPLAVEGIKRGTEAIGDLLFGRLSAIPPAAR